MPVVKKQVDEKQEKTTDETAPVKRTYKKAKKRGRPPIVRRGRPPKKGGKKAPYTKKVETFDEQVVEAKVETNAERASVLSADKDFEKDLNFDYVNHTNTKASFVAAFSYFFFFLGFIWCKDNKFVKFHANQALVMWISCVLLACLSVGLYYIWIPLGAACGVITFICVFAFLINGIANAVNGRARPLPVIGKITIIKSY